MSDIKKNINDWILHVSEADTPIFSGTVIELAEVVNSENSSAADVAAVILRDAFLTSRLLKMANSFFYNPTHRKINTVTQAVMLIGFEQVRALSLSLMLIDSVESEHNRNKIIEEMAQSFHAAVQAQELARLKKIKSTEGVFVATLLSRLGNMIYWAFSDDEKALEKITLLLDSKSEYDAEYAVLGFHLHDLTKELSKSWQLGGLLDQFLSGENSNDPLIELMDIGHYLAEESKHGWDEEQAVIAIKSVAATLNLSQEKVQASVYANAEKAREITKACGSVLMSESIPLSIDSSASSTADDGADELNKALFQPCEPNTAVQLAVLQDITEAIATKPSLDVIIKMSLEGISRGVGMDRAMFAILSEDRRKLVCKYAFGDGSRALTQHFKIDISKADNLFNQLIRTEKGMHISATHDFNQGIINKKALELLGAPPYLIMPAVVRKKVIGLFLADRNASQRSIETEDFLAFQQFCQQANMGLTFLTMQD